MSSWIPWRFGAPPPPPPPERPTGNRKARRKQEHQAREAAKAAEAAAAQPQTPSILSPSRWAEAWRSWSSESSEASAASLQRPSLQGPTASSASSSSGSNSTKRNQRPPLAQRPPAPPPSSDATSEAPSTNPPPSGRSKSTPAIPTSEPAPSFVRSQSMPNAKPSAPPNFMADASKASLMEVLSVLRKGAAQDATGEISANEFARVVAYADRPLRTLKTALQRQTNKFPASKAGAQFPFADAAHTLWPQGNADVQKFLVAHEARDQLQSLSKNLGALVDASERHQQSELLSHWVREGGLPRLRSRHEEVQKLLEGAGGELETMEFGLKERLTQAYTEGDKHACALPPVNEAVRAHVAQAAVLHFLGASASRQTALATNRPWRDFAAQVIRPALGFTHNVSGSSVDRHLINLLLTVKPEEEAIKVGNATWRLDYFKRGGEVRAYVARHVETGRAALLFYDTKHVKMLNGSWGASYDQELRKAVDKLVPLLEAEST